MIPCYVYITRSWIMSHRAKVLYLICAVLTLSMFGTVLALNLAVAAGRQVKEYYYVLHAIEFLVVLPGIFAAATIWVAMWYHWYGYNNDGVLSKSFWFLCLVLLGPLASSFYCFFPYRWNFSVKPLTPLCESSNS